MRRVLFLILGFLLIPGLLMAGGWAYHSPILRSYYFPTVNTAPVDSLGTALSVASASPPALWVHPVSTEPFLIEPGGNASLVGQYGIYGAPAITNLVQRASFESWDDANTPTGWVEVETAGSGAATSSEENSRVVHGGSSAKAVTTAEDASVIWNSNCIDIDDATAYYVDAWAFGGAGDDDFILSIVRYTDNACGVFDVTTDIANRVDVPEAWTHYGDASPAWGTTESVEIRVGFITKTTTAWVDGVSMRAASTPSDAYAFCDTDAPCVTNLQDITDDNPPEGMGAGGWTFEATVRSPIDGAVGGARYVFLVPGTAGNNNRAQMHWVSDVLYCDVYDSAGVGKSSSIAAMGNADTDYAVKCSKSSGGNVIACWDGACDATPATAAITTGIGAEIVFGGDGATGRNIWVNNPKFSRGAQ